MIAALTAAIPGWTYLYLPMLIGDIPEHRFQGDPDPRTLNRLTIASDGGLQLHDSPEIKRVRDLLAYLETLHLAGTVDHGHAEASVNVFADTGLRVRWLGAGVELLCNFASRRSIPFDATMLKAPVYAERVSTAAIGPLGFGLWPILPVG